MKKTEHSTFSNIFFFLGILFKISPALVIGECLWKIMLSLPTKLVAVLGIKYVIDIATGDGNKTKIIYAVLIIAAVIIISRIISWLYREFYWNVAKEKTQKGLSEKFYEKAKQLDLESYDNPHFYNSFILAIEASAGSFQGILNMVSGYVSELISLITIGTIILAIDPVCLLIILVTDKQKDRQTSITEKNRQQSAAPQSRLFCKNFLFTGLRKRGKNERHQITAY